MPLDGAAAEEQLLAARIDAAMFTPKPLVHPTLVGLLHLNRFERGDVRVACRVGRLTAVSQGSTS